MSNSTKPTPPLDLHRPYPLITVADLERTRAFYLEGLECTLVCDMGPFIQLRWGDETRGPDLSFMTPDAAEPYGTDIPAFVGKGLVVSLSTPDVAATYAKLVAKGIEALSEPVKRPWGWTSFLVRDPDGVLLDIFTPTP